jgi:N utilization substance protein B
MLYQWDLARAPIPDILASVPELRGSGEGARQFASEIVEGTVGRVETIDRLLAEHSANWRLDRMSVVDRNILRLAVYELLARVTPASVVINEAIEIAKRFSTPESTAFVNGVLDAVNAGLEAAAEKQ